MNLIPSLCTRPFQQFSLQPGKDTDCNQWIVAAQVDLTAKTSLLDRPSGFAVEPGVYLIAIPAPCEKQKRYVYIPASDLEERKPVVPDVEVQSITFSTGLPWSMLAKSLSLVSTVVSKVMVPFVTGGGLLCHALGKVCDRYYPGLSAVASSRIDQKMNALQPVEKEKADPVLIEAFQQEMSASRDRIKAQGFKVISEIIKIFNK
jgi:hypothetical protein